MASRLTIDQYSAKHQAEIAAQLHPKLPLQTDARAMFKAVKANNADAKRIRQHQGDGLNKWEREYRTLILTKWPDCFLHREVSLPLANGVKYKLDFLRVLRTDDGCHCMGFEVKGQARSTGIVKVKVAAQAYPWITFRLVTKRRKKDGGGWAEETVLP